MDNIFYILVGNAQHESTSVTINSPDGYIVEMTLSTIVTEIDSTNINMSQN